MNWWGLWWRQRQRSIDMRILWPVIKEETSDLTLARAAMFYHCMNDTAWTRDYSEEDLVTFIDQLN